jgi:hypothetical protein
MVLKTHPKWLTMIAVSQKQQYKKTLMVYYLKKDAVGAASRTLYAVQGEKVFLIAEHGNVFIVETEKGARFGVSTTSLSIEKVEESPKNTKNDTKKTPTNRGRKG